jgi:ferritin
MSTALISKPSLAVINDAIQAEMDAFFMYRHLANQAQRLGLFGTAKYFQNESIDELSHYQKHADFLNDRGTVAMLPSVEPMDNTVMGIKDALTIAYNAEVELGDKYSGWYSELMSDDPITAQHLFQFLEIQRKSIGEYADWLSRLSLVTGSVILIDQELGGK